jgi:hypothetical protein
MTATIVRELAAQLGTASTAREWLAEAVELTPDTFDAQLSLFVASLALEELLPGAALPGTTGEIERALVADDWQTAYNAAMFTPMGGQAILTRMLTVALGLAEAGDAEAALDVLTRALDGYPGEPAIYEALAPVLTVLGRHEDAEIARSLA